MVDFSPRVPPVGQQLNYITMVTAKRRARQGRGHWGGGRQTCKGGGPGASSMELGSFSGSLRITVRPNVQAQPWFMNSARCPRVLQDGAPVCSIVHLSHSAQLVQSVQFTGTTELRHLAWQGPDALPYRPPSISLFSPSQTGKGTPVFTTASQDFSKGMPNFEGRLANNNKQKQHLPCFHT